MTALSSVSTAKTIAEYLAFEEASVSRHEFHDGEIRAMSGGTERHARITSNLMISVGGRLRGQPCQSYDSNLRVAIENGNRFVYPDHTVLCAPPRVPSR